MQWESYILKGVSSNLQNYEPQLSLPYNTHGPRYKVRVYPNIGIKGSDSLSNKSLFVQYIYIKILWEQWKLVTEIICILKIFGNDLHQGKKIKGNYLAQYDEVNLMYDWLITGSWKKKI